MWRRTVPIMAMVWLLSGCSEAEPTSGQEESWIRATVKSMVSTLRYEAEGQFYRGRNDYSGVQEYFTVHSEDRANRRGLVLYRHGAGMPPVGTYALGPVNQADPRSQGFTAWYSEAPGDAYRSYEAAAGKIEITASSPTEVSGRFRFTGRLRAALPNADAAPTVEVEGTFRAQPGRDLPVILELRGN